MDWNKFGRECGPLYPHAVNALAIYKARVQDACAQTVKEQLDELCKLFGWKKDDVTVASYADPDKLPRDTREYFNLGAKLRSGSVDVFWMHLQYISETGDRFDFSLYWYVRQRDKLKSAELARKVSALKQKSFSDETWAFEDDSGSGMYFSEALRPEDLGDLLDRAKGLSRKALAVLSQCDDIASLVSTSASVETGTFWDPEIESSHNHDTTATA